MSYLVANPEDRFSRDEAYLGVRQDVKKKKKDEQNRTTVITTAEPQSLLSHHSHDTKRKNNFEPRHDGTNKMAVRPAKTQISLGGCPG